MAEQQPKWVRTIALIASVAASTLACRPTFADAPATQPVVAADFDRSYAVVVSASTYQDPDWRKVVDALVAKHGATVIQYTGSVNDSLPGLKQAMPRYACFVATPEEAGRTFVINISRLTRKLNDDPFGDVLWGIITGYSPADALRIASVKDPLVIRKGGAGTGLNLDQFDSGKWFSEGHAGEYWTKDPGGKPIKQKGETDSTKEIADFLDQESPDLFVTSGHASEHRWMLGYGDPYIRQNGSFTSKAGHIIAVDHQKPKPLTYPIQSTNPKVFLAIGNCLMGHIDGRDCMALGWLGSGGVDQFVGYTVVTWYGAMGWGTHRYMFDKPGQYSVAESFYFSNQCVLHDIATKFPKSVGVDIPLPDSDNGNPDKGMEDFQNALFKQVGSGANDKSAEDNFGLMWDRDVVAFYGDPAWDARLMPQGPKLTTAITQDNGGVYHFTVIADDTVKLTQPIAALLPHRLHGVQVLTGSDLQPLVTDNFVMLFHAPVIEKGKSYEVTFRDDELKKAE
jgi:zinc protease